MFRAQIYAVCVCVCGCVCVCVCVCVCLCVCRASGCVFRLCVVPARDQVGAYVGGLEVFDKLSIAVVDCLCVYV